VSKHASDSKIEKLLNLEKIEFEPKYDGFRKVVGSVSTGYPVSESYKIVCKEPDRTNDQVVYEKFYNFECAFGNGDK
jgi:hypothetical protein